LTRFKYVAQAILRQHIRAVSFTKSSLHLISISHSVVKLTAYLHLV